MTPKRLFPPLNCLCPLFGHGDKRVASTGAVSNQLDHTWEQLAPVAWPRRYTELAFFKASDSFVYFPWEAQPCHQYILFLFSVLVSLI